MRKPPRCLDCEHSVGPTGKHYNVEFTNIILCKECKDSVHHEVSMSLKYEGVWRNAR